MAPEADDSLETKRWWLAKLHLERARDRIPRSTNRPLGTGGVRELSLFAELAQRLEKDELEDALETLWRLGDLNNCRGGFWRELGRSAEYMNLTQRAEDLRVRFHQALATTVKGDRG